MKRLINNGQKYSMNFPRIYRIVRFAYKCRVNNWKNFEYFDESWKIRIHEMASLIEDERVILDLGCGKMWLRGELSKDKTYVGCDYKKRSEDTIICDFNKGQFPQLSADLCFVSGVLEYIEDTNWFIKNVKRSSRSVIMSYCTTDLNPNLKIRKLNGWVNHFSLEELLNIMSSEGYILYKNLDPVLGNEMMKFVRSY